MSSPVDRKEAVERDALAELHAAASDSIRTRLGLELSRVGSALVSLAAGEPGAVVNRTVGLGVEAPATEDEVRAIERHYAAAGVGRYYVHVPNNARPAELREWLAAAGLERGRGWARFRRGVAPAPETASSLRVERIGAEHAGAWGRIVARGFGLGESTAEWLAGLVERPAWRLYVGFDGDEPAGAAGMFVHDGAAWLDWAATLPEFRRRGCQGALLARRLTDALEAGCREAFTETGEAVEGDPQHSYRNILRAGFELVDVRENWVPRGA